MIYCTMNQQNKNGLDDLTESSGTIKSISKGDYNGSGSTYFVSLSFVNDSGEVSVVRFEYHHKEEADTLYECLESYSANTKKEISINVRISAEHIKGNLYEGIKLRILEKNGSTE